MQVAALCGGAGGGMRSPHHTRWECRRRTKVRLDGPGSGLAPIGIEVRAQSPRCASAGDVQAVPTRTDRGARPPYIKAWAFSLQSLGHLLAECRVGVSVVRRTGKVCAPSPRR